MDGHNVSNPFDVREEIRSLFNNSKWSDICFRIKNKKVFGHKIILSLASPVFERTFFGDLKEKGDEITIDNLSLVGFKNALR